jgi:spore maturation protein CgeB
VVVLGLSISSAWGNGHATTYRALLRAFVERGHRVLFLERDVPWYSGNRDFEPDFCDFALYSDLTDLTRWRKEIAAADAVIIGSFVPEGVRVGRWVQATATGLTVFYDIDTPVTLAKLEAGETDYLSPELIAAYDLYLSFAGGQSLRRLEAEFRSPAARWLACSVDEDLYAPRAVPLRWDLSYLGTYSADRQPALEQLLLEAARRLPDRRFCVAGAKFPATVDWPTNVERIEHVPPGRHPEFYSASRFTLNLTRADMIAAGHSPSVRLFESAACGTPIISDAWRGLDEIFVPDREISLAHCTEDVVRILETPEQERSRRAEAARHRVLEAHTARHRAHELEIYLQSAIANKRDPRSIAGRRSGTTVENVMRAT